MSTAIDALSALWRSAVRTVVVICLFVVALQLAWISLSTVNFLYPAWYEVLDIDAHIDRYGPQNRYRHGFEHTSREKHHALFAGMLEAINSGGQGLAELSYIGPGGKRVQLLRPPEQVHLQSVARLVGRLQILGHVMLGVLLLGVVVLRSGGLGLPSPRAVTGGAAALTALAGLGVMVYGAEDAFEAMHEMVFPAGEQWFFYYQESLMTTLLKAPDLFAALAVLLIVAALGWFALLMFALHRVLRPA